MKKLQTAKEHVTVLIAELQLTKRLMGQETHTPSQPSETDQTREPDPATELDASLSLYPQPKVLVDEPRNAIGSDEPDTWAVSCSGLVRF